MRTIRQRTALAGTVPFAAAFLALVFYSCQERDSHAAARAIDKERHRVADSTIAALRGDAAALATRVVRLRADSATLAGQSVALRATFQRDLARWQALAAKSVRHDTVVLVRVSDSLPTLEAVVAQAEATIASCQADARNCEQRAANAELRVVATDSLWRNAERRAEIAQRQADLFERRLYPSLWEQLRQVPQRAVSTVTIIGLTWAACRIGGGG